MNKPTFALREKLTPIQLGTYERARGNWTFQPFTPANLAHAGLILDKLLPGHDDESLAKKQVLNCSRTAARALSAEAGIYSAAYSRRESQLKSGRATVFPLEVASGSRLVIGLGSESPLEAGLRLHHTYGVPFIPGSALKGLSAHFCDAVVSEQTGNEDLRRVVEVMEAEKRTQRAGTVHELLFGNTDSSGFIVFHDAWIDPRSLARADEGLLLDVMTPHHRDYYGAKRYNCKGQPLHDQLIPPTDFDDPFPVPFLSVRGTFDFALEWNDGAPLPAEDATTRSDWLEFAKALLIAALGDWGIGGKTSSGYGRLVPPEAVLTATGEGTSSAARPPASKPATPTHVRGEKVTVTCVEPAIGKKKAKFRADDGFSGHIASEAQPATAKDETISLWVANVSAQGYTFSTAEPVTKQHQSGTGTRKGKWR